MSNEAKMREDYKAWLESRYLVEWPSDPTHPGQISYPWEAWKACAAIKDAEIAELKAVNITTHEKELIACDLMIKELREALNNLRLFTLEVDSLKLLSDLATEALAKSEHHNSRALEKMLLEAELKVLHKAAESCYKYGEEFRPMLLERHAKLSKLNKE